MVTDPSNDKELLILVTNGNEPAFEELYRRYFDTLYGVAFAYTKSEQIAEEVVQDVFIKIWMKRDNLTSIENFSNYVYVSARNNILNVLNKKTREKDYFRYLVHFWKEQTTDPEQEFLYKESQAMINKAVSLLPDQQRVVYQLVKNQDMKLEEVAEKLGISRNTVRNHLARAIQFIRVYISENSGKFLLIPLIMVAGAGCK